MPEAAARVDVAGVGSPGAGYLVPVNEGTGPSPYVSGGCDFIEAGAARHPADDVNRW
ncbi:hypothetical protein GCM10009646_86130 [Streptomyces aureus]